jgi:selT/selW/selH-like putative selenoprotein
VAAAIREVLGFEAELIRGGGGVFDVVADGDLIFSKYEVGRFPENEEVLSKLRK